MVRRSCLVLIALLSAAPSFAEPASDGAPSAPPPSIRQAIDAEVARLAAGATAGTALGPQATPARKPNWFRRHPVATASIGGFLTGFAAGWAMGDDGVFDDFTGEFNGVMVGGIVAGSAASVVGIARAFRK